jgi:hypothetical protein
MFSTNCITTHSKNAAQHPRLLIPMKTCHTKAKVIVAYVSGQGRYKEPKITYQGH